MNLSLDNRDVADPKWDPCTPSWVKILVDDCKMHPAWVQDLRNSMVADFSILRAGVVIHACNCTWLHDIKYLTAAKIPLWIYYGDVQLPDMRSDDIIFKKYYPTTVEIQWAQNVIDFPPFTPASPSAGTPLQELTSRPQNHNRQRGGEMWQQFFTRQEEANAQRLLWENDWEQTA